MCWFITHLYTPELTTLLLKLKTVGPTDNDFPLPTDTAVGAAARELVVLPVERRVAVSSVSDFPPVGAIPIAPKTCDCKLS